MITGAEWLRADLLEAMAEMERLLDEGVPLTHDGYSWVWRPSAADVIDKVREVLNVERED